MLGGAKLGTISIENVTFGYDIQGRLLFEDMSFDFDDRWKLGIIGKNGVGKTTFLKLLLDILPYKGSIRSNNTFHYFPLDLSGIDEQMPALLILQEFADFDQWELERECELLKLNKHLLWAPLQQYSVRPANFVATLSNSFWRRANKGSIGAALYTGRLFSTN